MARFDLDEQSLAAYRPDLPEPADLDDFWASTLELTRGHDLGLEVVPVDAGLDLVDVHDVTFSGFDGHRIKAWLITPRGVPRTPGIVSFTGYGGGRGLPHDHLTWAAAGFAHLVMDTRGQGSRWGNGGSTSDPVGSDAAAPGFMTRGILDPAQYYYRRVFADAVRAVEALRAVGTVDPDRVAVSGGSQGGGIALAAAALVPGLLGVLVDVPFLCHFRRAVEITDADPYAEITTYLSVHREHVDRVFETLAYFDGVHLAQRASAPALFSVALMDPVCPPSTVFAAFNHYGGDGPTDKRIETYPFNQHEGGQGFQLVKQISWLRARAGLGDPAGPVPPPTDTPGDHS